MVGRVLSLILGAIVAIVLFYALSLLVAQDDELHQKSTKTTAFDFIRTKTESEPESKKRIVPPKPKQQPMLQTPQISTSKQSAKPTLSAVKIDAPKINFSHDVKNNLLSGATAPQAQMSAGVNMNVIPLVRIPPLYPPRALQLKKEGFVTMRFTINTDGTVRDIKVVQSEPPKLFESAAISALKKWKFKPKIENGKAVEQLGEQSITFTLGDVQ